MVLISSNPPIDRQSLSAQQAPGLRLKEAQTDFSKSLATLDIVDQTVREQIKDLEKQVESAGFIGKFLGGEKVYQDQLDKFVQLRRSISDYRNELNKNLFSSNQFIREANQLSANKNRNEAARLIVEAAAVLTATDHEHTSRKLYAEMQGVFQGSSQDLSELAQTLETAGNVVRTVRDISILTTATIATGGAASILMKAGYSTGIVLSGSAAYGTVVGWSAGGILSTSEALSMIYHGQMDASFSSFTEFQNQRIKESGKSAAIGAAGATTGLGVAGALGSKLGMFSQTLRGRTVLGVAGGGSGSATMTTVGTADRIIQANLAFMSSVEHLDLSDIELKIQKKKFFEEQGLTGKEILRDAGQEILAGLVGGGIGGYGGALREQLSSILERALIKTAEASASGLAGVLIAGLDGEISAEEIAEEIGSVFLGDIIGDQASRFGAEVAKHKAKDARLVVAPESELAHTDPHSDKPQNSEPELRPNPVRTNQPIVSGTIPGLAVHNMASSIPIRDDISLEPKTSAKTTPFNFQRAHEVDLEFSRARKEVLSKDSPRYQYLQSIFSKIAETAGRPDLELVVLRTAEDVGCFKISFNTVVMSEGLLYGHQRFRSLYEKFPSEDMLAAFFSHEIAHSLQDTSSFAKYNQGLSQEISALSKQKEYNADEVGMKLLGQAGFDPSAMIDSSLFSAHLDRDLKSIMKEHPASFDRVRRLQALYESPDYFISGRGNERTPYREPEGSEPLIGTPESKEVAAMLPRDLERKYRSSERFVKETDSSKKEEQELRLRFDEVYAEYSKPVRNAIWDLDFGSLQLGKIDFSGYRLSLLEGEDLKAFLELAYSRPLPLPPDLQSESSAKRLEGKKGKEWYEEIDLLTKEWGSKSQDYLDKKRQQIQSATLKALESQVLSLEDFFSLTNKNNLLTIVRAKDFVIKYGTREPIELSLKPSFGSLERIIVDQYLNDNSFQELSGIFQQMTVYRRSLEYPLLKIAQNTKAWPLDKVLSLAEELSDSSLRDFFLSSVVEVRGDKSLAWELMERIVPKTADEESGVLTDFLPDSIFKTILKDSNQDFQSNLKEVLETFSGNKLVSIETVLSVLLQIDPAAKKNQSSIEELVLSSEDSKLRLLDNLKLIKNYYKSFDLAGNESILLNLAIAHINFFESQLVNHKDGQDVFLTWEPSTGASNYEKVIHRDIKNLLPKSNIKAESFFSNFDSGTIEAESALLRLQDVQGTVLADLINQADLSPVFSSPSYRTELLDLISRLTNSVDIEKLTHAHNVLVGARDPNEHRYPGFYDFEKTEYSSFKDIRAVNLEDLKTQLYLKVMESNKERVAENADQFKDKLLFYRYVFGDKKGNIEVNPLLTLGVELDLAKLASKITNLPFNTKTIVRETESTNYQVDSYIVPEFDWAQATKSFDQKGFHQFKKYIDDAMPYLGPEGRIALQRVVVETEKRLFPGTFTNPSHFAQFIGRFVPDFSVYRDQVINDFFGTVKLSKSETYSYLQLMTKESVGGEGMSPENAFLRTTLSEIVHKVRGTERNEILLFLIGAGKGEMPAALKQLGVSDQVSFEGLPQAFLSLSKNERREIIQMLTLGTRGVLASVEGTTAESMKTLENLTRDSALEYIAMEWKSSSKKIKNSLLEILLDSALTEVTDLRSLAGLVPADLDFNPEYYLSIRNPGSAGKPILSDLNKSEIFTKLREAQDHLKNFPREKFTKSVEAIQKLVDSNDLIEKFPGLELEQELAELSMISKNGTFHEVVSKILIFSSRLEENQVSELAALSAKVEEFYSTVEGVVHESLQIASEVISKEKTEKGYKEIRELLSEQVHEFFRNPDSIGSSHAGQINTIAEYGLFDLLDNRDNFFAANKTLDSVQTESLLQEFIESYTPIVVKELPEETQRIASELLEAMFTFYPPVRRAELLNSLVEVSISGGDYASSIAAVFHSSGPLMKKIGQRLADRPDLLADESIRNALQQLKGSRDSFSPRLPLDLAEDRGLDIVEIKGRPKRASAKAAYEASVRIDGEVREGMFKVVNPNFEKELEIDLLIVEKLFGKRDEQLDGWHKLVHAAAKELEDESSMQLEAENQAILAGNTNNSLSFGYKVKVPQALLVGEGIMFEPMAKGDSINQLIATGESLPQDVYRAIVGSFFTQVFRDGAFHAEMQGENVFFDGQTLSLIDVGSFGKASFGERVDYLQFFETLVGENTEASSQTLLAIIEKSMVKEDFQLAKNDREKLSRVFTDPSLSRQQKIMQTIETLEDRTSPGFLKFLWGVANIYPFIEEIENSEMDAEYIVRAVAASWLVNTPSRERRGMIEDAGLAPANPLLAPLLYPPNDYFTLNALHTPNRPDLDLVLGTEERDLGNEDEGTD